MLGACSVSFSSPPRADRNRAQKQGPGADRSPFGRPAHRRRGGTARRGGRPAVWRWQRRFGEGGVVACFTTLPAARSRLGAPTVGGRTDLRSRPVSDPLDRPAWPGQPDQPALGPAHLGRPRAPAAPPAHFNAPPIRSSSPSWRHRRPLRRPAEHAIVLSVDEKAQIQALDRTQPGLPLNPQGRDHDPRLQAPWHHHPICRPRGSQAPCSAAACSATATRSSCAPGAIDGGAGRQGDPRHPRHRSHKHPKVCSGSRAPGGPSTHPHLQPWLNASRPSLAYSAPA